MQDLYLFNPDNEISIANGTNGYTPKANISIMAGDLAFLSAYLAKNDDYVLVARMPDLNFMKGRREVFGLDCQPIIWEKAQLLSFNEIKPWGWSPRVHNLLKDLKSRCNEKFRESVMATWSEERRGLYSRRVAAACLTDMIRAIPGIGEEVIPCECRTLAEIRLLSEKRDIVVKAPWSSSGKGVLFIPKGQMTGKEEEVLSGFLHKQGYVMVEKRLNRVLDFAMEFFADEWEQVHFIGYSLFETDKRGVYKENLLAADRVIEARISTYVSAEILHQVGRALQVELAEVIKGSYEGYLGVDMMICRTQNSGYAIHPCVEINLRMNMGVVARLIYDNYVCDGGQGRYVIEYYAKPGEAWHSHLALQEKHPLYLENGKVKSGYLSLTPVENNTSYQAYILI